MASKKKYNLRERKPNVSKFVNPNMNKYEDSNEDFRGSSSDSSSSESDVSSSSSKDYHREKRDRSEFSDDGEDFRDKRPRENGSKSPSPYRESSDIEDFVVPDNVEADIYQKLKDALAGDNDDWVLDTTLLGTIIEKKIIGTFPDLKDSANKLHTTIIQALSEADEGLVEQYSSAKPKDKTWKLSLPEEKVAILEPRLQETRAFIDSEAPSIPKILEPEMSIEDRAYLIQLFDICKNTEPFTQEEFDLKRKINRKMKEMAKNVAEKIYANSEEKRIMESALSLASDSFKFTIVNLKTDDAKKKRMLEVYQEMEETPTSSTMYRTVKEKMEWMVSLPYNEKKTA